MALTTREKQIAQLVRRGWTSREIADVLGITQRTVEAHRLNIRRRRAQPSSGDRPALERALQRLSKRVSVLAAEVAHLRSGTAGRSNRLLRSMRQLEEGKR